MNKRVKRSTTSISARIIAVDDRLLLTSCHKLILFTTASPKYILMISLAVNDPYIEHRGAYFSDHGFVAVEGIGIKSLVPGAD